MKRDEKDKGVLLKIAGVIERAGNKLPPAAFLFLYLMLAIAVISFICSMAGVSVEYEVRQADGTFQMTTVEVVNILSKSGISTYLTKMLSEYTNLQILSLCLFLVMGSGLAEHTGFFSAVLRKAMLSAPRKLTVYALAVIGICCNICGDTGMILAATIGGIVYKSLGRNPWVGVITGYASAAAGYTANLIPASVDANLAGITLQMCESLGIETNVNVLSNYIFMVVSTFVLAAVVTFLSETFLVKQLGDRQGAMAPEELEAAKLTPAEEKGVRWAGIAFAVYVVLLLICTVPKNGLLRSAEGALVPKSPFMSAIVPLIFLAFCTVGIAYGYGAGTIKDKRDIPKYMSKGVATMNDVCVTFFFVSQMLYMFNVSKLATVLSVLGERFLRSIHLGGLGLLIVFIFLVAFLNVFMISASSKYLILAPIFIGMFNNLGIDPVWTQLAYRIGDSCTNSISPLNACLFACIGILNNYRDEKYNPEPAGLGTVMSSVFVFCMAMLVSFVILFVVFYLFGIPVGIGN